MGFTGKDAGTGEINIYVYAYIVKTIRHGVAHHNGFELGVSLTVPLFTTTLGA